MIFLSKSIALNNNSLCQGRYEQFHQVEYSQQALQAAVSLALRFLPSRRFPDKALDLLDDAAARRRLLQPPSSSSPPVIVIEELDVAQVVSASTGIPLAFIASSYSSKDTPPGRLEQQLGDWVLGQQHAVSAVCSHLQLGRAGLSPRNGPLGVFLLLGGSGVGKTELAKRVSQLLFPLGGGNEEEGTLQQGALLRLDMSEYMEAFSVSRLIGAPPGYVGYADKSGSGGGGLLTEAIRNRPYQARVIIARVKDWQINHDILSCSQTIIYGKQRTGCLFTINAHSLRWCCWTSSRRPIET